MSKTDAYEGIIFDYGGVLVHHQSESDHKRMAEVARLPVEQLLALYWSDLRFEYDKGWDGERYWNEIANGAGVSFSEQQIADLIEIDTNSWLHYDEAMWEWLQSLRAAGKRIAMLSNMPRELGIALRDRTTRLQMFDHVTLSCDQKSAKPEPAIYRECLEGIGTPAAKTLFLDDRLPNITAADKLGIAAMQFTTSAEILGALR